MATCEDKSTGVAQIGKTHFRINTRNRGGVIGASRSEQLFRDRSDWFLSTLVPPALIHSQQQRGRKLTWKKGPLVQKGKQEWQKMGNISESMVIMPCFISIACMYVFFRSFERQPLEFEKACHLFWVKQELQWERFTGKIQACVLSGISLLWLLC